MLEFQFQQKCHTFWYTYCQIAIINSSLMGPFIYILESSILVNSHFDLVNLLLALEATEPGSQPVTQMALEVIKNHLISVQQKR